jgi:transketolase
MRKQFIKSMKDILYSDSETVLLLGDIGIFGFREEISNIPNRVYNIGILEQSTISVAAGMARMGLKPFVHTIAPFIVERGLEQLKVDFGYQKLGGNFVSVGSSYDYAGLGCTHHCPGDVQSLLGIPNMKICVPGTSLELDALLKNNYKNNLPTYYRLSEYENKNSHIECDEKFTVIKKGNRALVVCFGNLLDSVMESTMDMDVTLVYSNTVCPLDGKSLIDNFNETIIVCEPFYEGSVNFLINKALSGLKFRIFNIGVPREFLYNYGDKKEHDISYGLDSDGMKNRISKCLES